MRTRTTARRAGCGRLAMRAACATAAALLLLAPAAAGQVSPALPDLVSDPPGLGAPLEVYDDGSGSRLLLRFDGYIHNRGQGKLELRGSSPSGGYMGTVVQRLFRPDGSFLDSSSAAQLAYETNDDHAHWHLKHAARYSLWNEARTAEVAPASKVGFCLLDSEAVDAHAGAGPYTWAATSGCGWGQTGGATVYMGVSPGYRDVYGSGLAFQWVDVSQVSPGRYWLRSDVDPDGVIKESQEANSAGWAAEATTIPGHVAAPVAGGTATAGSGKPITLKATTWGTPGPLQFKVVQGPSHGTLSRPTGQWFSGDQVTYTPDAGYAGPDSFTFAARDASSQFPLSPPTAAATVQVQAAPPPSPTPVPDPPPAAADPPPITQGPGPVVPPLSPQSQGSTPPRKSILISGAPGRMYAGTGAQLTASVTGSRARPTWSVNGRRGGSRSAGKISQTGLYRAPKAVPRGRSVRIGAAVEGLKNEVVVRIDAPPTQRPSPSVSCASRRTRRQPLSCLRMSHHGGRLLVKLVSHRAGSVKLRARRFGAPVGSCAVRAPRGRAVTCSMRVGGHDAAGLDVRAVLLVRHRVVAVRHGLVR